MKSTLGIILLLFLAFCGFSQDKVMFAASDGVTVSADTYLSSPAGEVLILCHQAGYSRGEYLGIAKKLSAKGYNCIALDQRSGEQVNGVMNETWQRATATELPTTYLDAEKDILAAIDFAYKNSNRKVILWGSSYSASLVLKIAKENDKVKAVLAFSPGEYFGDQLHLAETISGLSKPVFLTSSQKEAPAVTELAKGIDEGSRTQFIPKTEGFHGSKALWEDKEGNEEYWEAVWKFLEKH